MASDFIRFGVSINCSGYGFNCILRGFNESFAVRFGLWTVRMRNYEPGVCNLSVGSHGYMPDMQEKTNEIKVKRRRKNMSIISIIVGILGFLIFALTMVVVISAIAIFTILSILIPLCIIALIIVLIVRAVKKRKALREEG